jgi:prophage regulatory protein
MLELANKHNLTFSEGANVDVSEFLDARALEQLTGIKASTWRYWAYLGNGPASFKLGRHRLWRRSDVMAWIAEQESDASA